METLTISPQLILAIGGVIALGLVLIKLGRQIAIFLLAAGVIAAVLVVGLAILDQAKATQQAAEAAAVASTGQTAASVSTIVLATLLAMVVIAGGLGFAYLIWRLRRAERRAARQTRQWRPGPNARWGQVGDARPVPYGHHLAAPPPVYYPPIGYAPPPAYPANSHQPYPSVVVIDDRDRADEDPLAMLPLWAEDDEMEGW